jgi:hypothetical protein
MGGASSMNEKRYSYRLLEEKPEGKKPIGRPRRSWVDNIRMNLNLLETKRFLNTI